MIDSGSTASRTPGPAAPVAGAKSRIFIVDDHTMFREGMKQLIDREPDLTVCGDAADVAEALRSIPELKPDLVIVDLSLAGSPGLDLIKTLRAQYTHLPVLVVSMHEESLYAERVLRAGASGYITKHQGPGEVVEAVRRVLGGEVYVSDKMASEFLRSFSTGGPKSTPHSVDRLTDRELAVLELIGKGRTTREIAATLKLGVATIDTYRARIKEKMNFNNAAELLHFAIRWVRDRE